MTAYLVAYDQSERPTREGRSTPVRTLAAARALLNGVLRYRYPTCCVLAYCADILRDELPSSLRRWQTQDAMCDLGYVPCLRCCAEQSGWIRHWTDYWRRRAIRAENTDVVAIADFLGLDGDDRYDFIDKPHRFIQGILRQLAERTVSDDIRESDRGSEALP
jgi:hypothetical protein